MTWFEMKNKNPKMAIIITFIIISIFIVIALILPFTLNRFFNTPIPDILAITGALAIPLGAISLAVSIFIASRQDMQLSKLTNIGVQTSDTVERLTTDSSIQNKIKRFFYNYGSDDSIKKYKCIYPVTYNIQNPLPQVSQADFYVFHVLGSNMGEENLDIMGIPNDLVIGDEESLNEMLFLSAPKIPG